MTCLYFSGCIHSEWQRCVALATDLVIISPGLDKCYVPDAGRKTATVSFLG